MSIGLVIMVLMLWGQECPGSIKLRSLMCHTHNQSHNQSSLLMLLSLVLLVYHSDSVVLVIMVIMVGG